MTEPLITSYTSRLGLRIPGFDDELDSVRPNWDRLDDTLSGALWVTAGTVPQDDVLFEGAIIAEIGTNKVWRAVKNKSGTYSQRWIKYPWLISATFTGNLPSADHGPHEWGFNAVTSSQCINSNITAIKAGRVTVPIAGLYTGCDVIRWTQTGAPAAGGVRDHKILINGLVDSGSEVSEPVTGYQKTCITINKFNRKLNAGDTVVSTVYATVGPNDTVHTLRLALNRPL